MLKKEILKLINLKNNYNNYSQVISNKLIICMLHFIKFNAKNKP
jgi:hypothetical protein